jgi:hypothetical protein
MNRSEEIFYKASEICDRWVEWYRVWGQGVDWKSLVNLVLAAWREEEEPGSGPARIAMVDLKIAIFCYSGMWRPDQIVTGHADDIVFDTAYSMICNYFHGGD